MIFLTLVYENISNRTGWVTFYYVGNNTSAIFEVWPLSARVPRKLGTCAERGAILMHLTQWTQHLLNAPQVRVGAIFYAPIDA